MLQKQFADHPELKGFTRAGLYRMIQFYETNASSAFVAAVGRQTQVPVKRYCNKNCMNYSKILTKQSNGA